MASKWVLGKRVVTQGVKSARVALPIIIKPARTLWNEIIGFLFIVMAIFPFGSSVVRTARHYNGDTGSLLKMIMGGFFALVLGSYGISSFLRARKISRS